MVWVRERGSRGLVYIFLTVFFLVFNGCGGTTSSEDVDLEPVGTDDGEDIGGDDSDDDSVNTAKLVGTPFEDLTSGDDFSDSFFLCDQYRTDTIDSFPIRIFTAFFTGSEEEIIQDGIDLANTAMEFTAYETTETWSDDLRVIYKITQDDEDISAETEGVYFTFNSKIEAEKQVPDWAIKIRVLTPGNYYLAAHELGHASGIRSHLLIDYENDTLTDLEDNSIMESDVGDTIPPALNDYNYMMSMQGEIMQNHLGEEGDIVSDPCDDE